MGTNFKTENSEDARIEQSQGFHLSPQQKRLWLLQQRDPVYVCQLAVALEGALDVGLLREALQNVMDGHEILRTTFKSMPGMRVPMQVVHARVEASWRQVELIQTSAGEKEVGKEAGVDDILVEERRHAFDFERGPLLRAVLCASSAREHVLVLTLPSICADDATLPALARELARSYARTDDETPADEDAPPQYADLAAWQNDLLESVETEAGRARWSGIDWSAVETSHVPAGWGAARASAGSGGEGFTPGRVAVRGGAQLWAEMAEAARREGVSALAFALACWEATLWRLSGLPSLAVGLSVDGRTYESLSEALGPLSRVVPSVVEVEAATEFAALAHSAERRLSEARAYGDYFDWGLAASSSGAGAGSYCAWQFEWAGGEDVAERPADDEGGAGEAMRESGGGVSFTLLRHSAHGEPFELKLRVAQSGTGAGDAGAGGAWTEVEYDAGLYDARQAQVFAECYEAVTRSACGAGRLRVGELEALSESARDEVLEEWNETQREYEGAATVVEMISAQAERAPEAVAVVCGGERVTYRELEARAEELASRLRSFGVGPERAVGLYVERSAAMVVGMLGIMKAGGVYVPLDPDNPRERVSKQIESVQASVLITQENLLNRLPDAECAVLCLDREPQAPGARQGAAPKSVAGQQNPAYIIFTSGSSGTPKGVAVTHQSLSNYSRFICDKLRATGATASDAPLRFAAVSTFAADLGHTCIFPALISGGSLHILSYEEATDSGRFGRYISEHSIDVLKIVPSHLNALLSAEEGSVPLPRTHLILGGEALSFDLLDRLSKLSEGCRLINHYGPTETTVGSLTFDAAAAEDGARRSATVPVGRPIANTKVYILDGRLKPVPVGVSGELYIGGDGLARGYVNEPGLTAERFVPHPFSRRGGERLYKTGDLARYLPDGNVEFLGRADSQVKIRGFRIELGEIESVLRQHPGVAEAVVTARDDAPGDKRLVAYVVFRSGVSIPTNELRAYLTEKLPEQMIPAAFVELRALPLTSNGKVDRRALPAPDWEHPQSADSFIAPGDAREELLAEIWSQVLGVERVGVNDNFFELGGDSIMSIQIAARVNRSGLGLAPMDIFRHPTIAELSVTLSASAPAQGEPGAESAPERSPEARDYSPADFPQVQLDQQKLNSILQRVSVGEYGTD